MKKKDEVSYRVLLLIIFIPLTVLTCICFILCYGYEEVTIKVTSTDRHENKNRTSVFGNIITDGEVGKRTRRNFTGDYIDQIEVGAIYRLTRRGPHLLNITKLEEPL